MQDRSESSAGAKFSLRRIERLSASLRRPDISHAIFDFDGTLSWLRHGWPRVMLGGFLNHAPQAWRENKAMQDVLLADILSLNGKPTIHQMESFAQRLRMETGLVAEPELLFGEYETRLREAVAERSATVRAGLAHDEFVVHGARVMLDLLAERGVKLIILSGTVENEVRAEAGLLGLSSYFGNHIYGSARGAAFSKRDVIERIMREEGIGGHHLLSFGDGPVEIQFTKAAGGLAIGVASDEDHNGSHVMDPFKREQLSRAGADALIPDYDEARLLMEEIFSK